MVRFTCSYIPIGAYLHPFVWGYGKDAPLITKALEVEQYYETYKKYLMEFTGGTFADDCKQEVKRLQSLVSQYVKSPDLIYTDTSNGIYDECASWCGNYGRYRLLSGGIGTNYFLTKAHSVQEFANPTMYTVTFNANGGTIDENGYEIITKTVLSTQKLVEVATASASEAGFYFDGWHTDTSGEKEETYATSDMTVYAHYYELILPHKYWKDENGIEYLQFTYRSSDFYYDGTIEYVVPACPINNWSNDGPCMEFNGDGTYTYTYISSEWDETFQEMQPFARYKFRVNDTMGTNWLGSEEYKHKLPEEYVNSGGNYDFLIPEMQK